MSEKPEEKFYQFNIDTSNIPSEVFVKAESAERALFAAYMAIEGFFDGKATEISAEEYAAADDDLKDSVLG